MVQTVLTFNGIEVPRRTIRKLYTAEYLSQAEKKNQMCII